jgi:hypothetical protein
MPDPAGGLKGRVIRLLRRDMTRPFRPPVPGYHLTQGVALG